MAQRAAAAGRSIPDQKKFEDDEVQRRKEEEAAAKRQAAAEKDEEDRVRFRYGEGAVERLRIQRQKDRARAALDSRLGDIQRRERGY